MPSKKNSSRSGHGEILEANTSTVEARTGPRGRPEITLQQARMHVGPLPPPDTLKAFDDAVPGAAERIIRMAELEQAHRHQTNDKITEAATTESRRGQWLGAGVSVTAIVAGCLLGGWPGAAVAVACPLLIFGRTIVVALGDKKLRIQGNQPLPSDDD